MKAKQQVYKNNWISILILSAIIVILLSACTPTPNEDDIKKILVKFTEENRLTAETVKRQISNPYFYNDIKMKNEEECKTKVDDMRQLPQYRNAIVKFPGSTGHDFFDIRESIFIGLLDSNIITFEHFIYNAQPYGADGICWYKINPDKIRETPHILSVVESNSCGSIHGKNCYDVEFPLRTVVSTNYKLSDVGDLQGVKYFYIDYTISLSEIKHEWNIYALPYILAKYDPYEMRTYKFRITATFDPANKSWNLTDYKNESEG